MSSRFGLSIEPTNGDKAIQAKFFETDKKIKELEKLIKDFINKS